MKVLLTFRGQRTKKGKVPLLLFIAKIVNGVVKIPDRPQPMTTFSLVGNSMSFFQAKQMGKTFY